jgi:hypothetical protein
LDPLHLKSFVSLPSSQIHRYLDIPEQDLGLRCRPGNTAATLNAAIFPRPLLLFYIVYNGGKSRTARAQPHPPQSLSWKKGKLS